MDSLKALVLAGGLSTRLGSDKSLLEIEGKRLIEKIIDAIKDNKLELRISCRADQINALSFYGKCIIDVYLEIGPMGGILSALNKEPYTSWLVLACDMPNIDSGFLKDIISQRDSNSDISCYINSNGYPEPLSSIWEYSSKSYLVKAVSNKDYSLMNVIKSLRRNEITSISDNGFFNINTPEDLNKYLL